MDQMINHKVKLELVNDDLKIIQEQIDKCCTFIDNNQKNFINSLLNKEHRSIVLDRIRITNNDGSESLITDPNEIAQIASDHFANQFRKRNHKFNDLPQEWKTVYEPLQDLNENVYRSINDYINETEWLTTIKSIISNISYRLIKKGPKELQHLLILLASFCIRFGIIPD